MGLGGYLAGKNEIDHFDAELRREYYEVDHFPEKEKEEVKEIFADYGLSESAQDTIVEELSKDKDKWVQFMMRYELGLERPDPKRAQKSALYIASSYILGGFIPLSAYFFTDNTQKGLIISSIMTIISLGIFGYFKTKIVGQPPFIGALKTIMIGTIAAAAAFGIARAIGG
jgi:VIT1/CCC1 family predicted Fe2+/Mn2+ transporter